jgi:hypothetical protein
MPNRAYVDMVTRDQILTFRYPMFAINGLIFPSLSKDSRLDAGTGMIRSGSCRTV